MNIFSLKKTGLAMNGLASVIAAGAFFAALPIAGAAADAPAASNTEKVALYEGADRQQRLIEAAKKEGTFNLYTSVPLSDMEQLTNAFKAKYGIPVKIWRSGSEQVTNRVIAESGGHKFTVDVVAGASAQLEALSREKLLQKVNSPYIKKLMEEAVPSHHEWAPVYLNIFVQAYNTNLIKKDQLPQTYEQLLDPKWKGKIAIEATDDDWFSAVVNQMGEKKGLQYFRDLGANGLSVRTGHTLLTQLVAAGEVPYGLTVFSYKARQLKHDGAPLDWYAIKPAIARSNAIAVAKNAPHPNAAVLFYDFVLSDGQKILVDMFYDPTNKDYQSAANNFPVKFINDQEILDQYAKWSKLYNDIVLKRAGQ